MRTNWSRCSKLLVACLVLVSALALPATAATTSEADVPGEAQVGEQVSASVTLTELYRNPQLESWDLAGSTELESVTWTVLYYDQTGSKVDQRSFSGQNFSGATVSAEEGVSEVRVRVTGTVPEVDAYAYDPAQNFTVLSLTQQVEGGASNELLTERARHFTEESQAAREDIDAAKAAIAGSNADTSEAESSLESAVSAYEGGNFELASKLAGEASEQAQQAQQSSQMVQFAMYGAGALLVLGMLGGGFAWYRSKQSGYDKLG